MRFNQALPLAGIHGHDGGMAGAPTPRKFELAKVDSWLAVLQWAWDRAYALVASTAGAAMMGYSAKATTWIAQYGPIAWGLIALAAFVLIYSLLIWGRSRLASARLARASAMVAERASEHASTNPLKEDFRNERIRLTDLYTPMGDAIVDRTFKRCDLIGPAVIWVSPWTEFARNRIDNVEFIRVNANTARLWPNKLAVVRGSIMDCHLMNVIFLVGENEAESFVAKWNGGHFQWMNDPIPQAELPRLPSPPDTEQERPR